MTTALPNPHAFPASMDDGLDKVAQLASIESLHALYSQRIYRFLLASTRNRDLAETLTQETFLKAWMAREQFRGECAASTWLTRIALNLLRDHTRTGRFRFWQRAAQTSVDAQDIATHLPHRTSSAEAGLIAHEEVKRVWETVEGLSEKQRTVFLLRFVEEMELPAISQATGMPLSTVKTHLYRSLAIVRDRHHPAAGKEPR